MKIRISGSILIIIFCFILSSLHGQNQKKNNAATPAGGRDNTSPNWGIGLKFGDPSGITIKKYMTGSAWELNIGRSHILSSRGWYDRSFETWYRKKNFGYKDFQYIGYKQSSAIGIQLHYLFQKPIASTVSNTGRLDYYLGFGGQLRTQRYSFDYRYKLDGNSEWFYSDGATVTDLDLGVDGVAGLEYFFKRAPISVFTDLTLFMEVVDAPFLFWMQGGLGVRVTF